MGIVYVAIEVGGPNYGGQDWPCSVIFGPEDHYLAGATTLEIFGLMVDPVGERLIPRIYRAKPF